MLAVACGGRIESEADSRRVDAGPVAPVDGGAGPGSVHEGWGVYELTIVPTYDDCQPPFESGHRGPVPLCVTIFDGRVSVVSGGINVWSDKTLSSYEHPVSVRLADCPGRVIVDLDLVSYDADGIDILFQQRFTDYDGPCTKPNDYPAIERDCTSNRLYGYRFLYACSNELASEPTVEQCIRQP